MQLLKGIGDYLKLEEDTVLLERPLGRPFLNRPLYIERKRRYGIRILLSCL